MLGDSLTLTLTLTLALTLTLTLTLALTQVVMLTENKERFVAAEGIELMLLVIKNKKYARLAALKTLDFALTRCVR